MDHVQIQPFAVGADQKLGAPVLRNCFRINSATGYHVHILPLRSLRSIAAVAEEPKVRMSSCVRGEDARMTAAETTALHRSCAS